MAYLAYHRTSQKQTNTVAQSPHARDAVAVESCVVTDTIHVPLCVADLGKSYQSAWFCPKYRFVMLVFLSGRWITIALYTRVVGESTPASPVMRADINGELTNFARLGAN